MTRHPPDPEVARVARAVLRLGRRLRAARPQGGLTLPVLGLLATLRSRGPMPAVALARAERLQPQSLSRWLARLEADGRISRTRGTADRRTAPVALTPAGLRALGRDMAARRAWLKRAMAATLTPAERARLAEAADLMLRLASFGLEPVEGEAKGSRGPEGESAR